MLYTVTPSEMRRVERRVMDKTGTPSQTLMERAAAHVADAALPYLRGGGTLLVACGTGNNGGDGLAATRLLLSRLPALRATVWRLAGEPTAETAAQWEKLKPFAGRVTTVKPGEPLAAPAGAALAIDALFGTGLNRPLTGAARAMVQAVNASGLPVVAVDIPSGLSGETGFAPEAEEESPVVRADVTVTFHRHKPGLFLGDGPDYCGRVAVADIGIPSAWDDAGGMALLAPGDALLTPRRHNTHKGTYGRVLALAGSRGMAGAAAVCATAALRAGAGLVTVACPDTVVPTVQALCPCATCLPLPETDVDAAWARLTEVLEKADALIAGCGLGREALAAGLMKRLIPWLYEHRLPAVLDADALNLMAARGAEGLPDGKPLPEDVILTPHPGEAARLLRRPVSQITADAPAAARELRRRYGGAAVLKGAASVLIAPDGEALNVYGTPAMAKGGSGDALSGVLGALLAGRETYGLRGVRLLQVACALHGLAGLAAADRFGERGVLATDLCAELGRVPAAIPERLIALKPMQAQRRETAPQTTVKSAPDLRSVLGRRVRVTVDRPIGSRHPDHKDVVYPLNYGYVADVLAADNEWQDAYILGVSEPVECFEGEVAAVIHRLDDVEDKWVVVPVGEKPTAEAIRAQTAFVEKFFRSEIVL